MRSHLPRFIFACLFGTLCSLAPAQQNWRWLNMLPATAQWKSVAYGNGLYVVVGADATIATSADGVSWTLRRMSTANQALNGVAYANGRFVAVGMGIPGVINAGLIMTSTDGITWTTNDTIAANYLTQFSDVTYGNGLWVVTGAGQNRVLTSTDGLAWTARDATSSSTKGAFGGGKFVLLAGSNRALVSSDTITWTQTFIAGDATHSTITAEGITYANGKFTAAGRDNNFNAQTYSSVDGITWTASTTFSTGTGGVSWITFQNGIYVAAGTAGLFSSTDGATWTKRTSAMPPTRLSTPGSVGTENLSGVGGGNNLLIATGIYGSITTSPDGTTWTRRSSGTAHDLYGIVYDGTKFVITGTGGTVLTSTDGTNWTSVASGQTGWFGNLVYAKGRYVTAGVSGLFSSGNLTSWTSVTTSQMYSVIFANDMFVAAYFGGTGAGIRVSSDGVTWTNVTVPNNGGGATLGLAGGGGSFVVTTGQAGGVPKIHSSTNGTTWVDSTPGSFTTAATTLAYGNGRYVLIAGTSAWTSTNGSTWTSSSLPAGITPVQLQFVGGRFVARNDYVTDAGSFVTSTDGVTWNKVPNSLGTNLIIQAMVEKDGVLYGVTGGGGIIRADVADGTTTGGTGGGANPGRLINMSIRTNAGTGDNTLIVGVAFGGAGTSGSKAVLVRGVGPTLGSYGVSGALTDPVLTAYQGSTVVGQNDDWAGGFDFNAVGAFPFAGNTPKDAAIYNAATPAGSYSVQITGKNNGTGIALAEIYDATPSAGFTTTTPRLVNVSARAQVGTGDNILIAGFVVGGSTSVRVLIRASGPALAAYGVGGTLANPKLEVFNSSNAKITENDDWAGTTELKNAFTSVGAFNFAADSSKDAALIVTLQPGNYTAQVSGVGATTGVGLVEVYELP